MRGKTETEGVNAYYLLSSWMAGWQDGWHELAVKNEDE